MESIKQHPEYQNRRLDFAGVLSDYEYEEIVGIELEIFCKSILNVPCDYTTEQYEQYLEHTTNHN